MEPGEKWAYREKASAPVVEVEIIRLGTKRPARVLIRHVDDLYEGREEWVPPARLKVPWEEADLWIENDRRWTALRDASNLGYHDPEMLAAEFVFAEVVDEDLLMTGWGKDSGVLIVKDLREVTKRYEIDPDMLTSHPLTIQGDDGLFAPWPTTCEVAQHLARRYADEVLTKVAIEEEQHRRDSIHGRYSGGRHDSYIRPEICAELAETYRPGYELLRQWCGSDASDRLDELTALRTEVRRLGQLIERAVTLLEQAGRAKEARELATELGIPVETLRAAARQDHRR